MFVCTCQNSFIWTLPCLHASFCACTCAVACEYDRQVTGPLRAEIRQISLERDRAPTCAHAVRSSRGWVPESQFPACVFTGPIAGILAPRSSRALPQRKDAGMRRLQVYPACGPVVKWAHHWLFFRMDPRQSTISSISTSWQRERTSVGRWSGESIVFAVFSTYGNGLQMKPQITTV